MKFKEERLKNMIIQEISKAIAGDEVKDPRIPRIITLTYITLSKDKHYCHVYFTILGDDAAKSKALIGLNSAKGYFQKILSERLQMRFTPKIEFRYDENQEEAFKVSTILSQISKEKEEDSKK